MFDNERLNFDMFIIERIEDDYDLSELRDKEQYYIDYYDTIENGLNKQRSGNLSKDMKEYKKEYQKSDKWKDYHKEYQKSDKYKEYYKSDKWKAYQKEYQKEYYKKKKLNS